MRDIFRPLFRTPEGERKSGAPGNQKGLLMDTQIVPQTGRNNCAELKGVCMAGACLTWITDDFVTRTFRELKESYLRHLERQVTSLQKNEISIQGQLQHLQSRVSRLEGSLNASEAENQKLHAFVGGHDGTSLAQTSISKTALFDQNESTGHSSVNTTIWVESTVAQAAHLHIRNTSHDGMSAQLPSPDLSTEGNAHANTILEHESVSVGGQMMAQLRHPPQLSDKVCLLEMDLIIVGMEFVLK